MLTIAEASAIEFNAGALSGSFDTTITAGALFRVQDRDPDLVGAANQPGVARGFSVNVDDGNLNYDRGLASLLAQVTHELKLDYENYGAFARASYFYDWINAENSSTRGSRTNRVPLSDTAVEAVGRDFELLDAYVYGNWDIADRPVTLRVGNQVLSWGESTFIPGGLSVINPFDVAALRAPGAEVRDALVPVPMISGSAGLTDDLSVEGFYQFTWEPTELEPRGTLFSTNDFAAPGGEFVFLGFGSVPDTNTGTPTATTPLGSRVPRGPDDEARDQGQFGIAARYFAEELNETEFAAYFVNHHSRLPVINAVAGTQAGLFANNYVGSARYRVAYPEDIKVLGASFNSNIGGITLQGEYSFRKDQPLQVDDVELLQAATAPGAIFATCAAAAANPANAAAVAQCQGTATIFNTNQILRETGQTYSLNPATALAQAGQRFGQSIEGFRRHDVSQAQLTATKVFPPALGADQWLMVGEVGAVYVHGMPEKSALRFDGPGTFLGGNSVFLATGMPAVQAGGFADQFSWGYRLRTRFDYLNAVGPVNLYPILSWSHDVNGTTPLPLGTFLEDRKAVSIGLQGTYLDSLTGEIQYTSFFGGEDFNLIHDRDFVSLSLKYAF